MKHSIKIQLISVFIGIIAFTIILCWGMNNFFLKTLYFRDKQDALRESYTAITQMMEREDYDGLNAEMGRMRYADNISFIMAIPVSWQFVETSANFTSVIEKKEMLSRLQENFNETAGEPRQVKVLETTSYYVIQEKMYPASNTSYMECYGTLKNNNLFLMSIPLAPVEESVRIANSFLLITCMVGMVMAIILVSFITQGITRPIYQLADLSKRMANLDFESRYDGDQENEVGILGNSMNQMADQLKKTIEELQEANKQLVKDIEEKIQIDELRKEFLSNVSHELKTPIALIQGYAEGLQDVVNEDPDSRNFYCEVIIDEADKMNTMVKKLLTLNHLEFGQDALTPEVFDLTEMLDTVISSNKLIGEKQDIRIVKNYNSPCMVYADEFKIEEVCTNYLSNAMHHAEGQKLITVSVADEGKNVRVTVVNTGKPIPQEDLENVWIKFFKVDKARTREYGGSGIGLSIVKAIMEAHDQPCGVYNTSEGVAFWFCLEKAKGDMIG
ncbi:MAG: HAMP domain-containing histidine kinase [Lachnospiraceae bacterium]|nr:HAMP domain-containing histidine kinase [Lachnospiraceae bacterium]